MIETELCTFTLEACQIAADMGITRVELCASPYEGGTTPSAAFIRMARRIPHLKLSVMIRPRGGDFLYSDKEFHQMLEEISFAHDCGADCVVAGILTSDGRVDEIRKIDRRSQRNGIYIPPGFRHDLRYQRSPRSPRESRLLSGTHFGRT